jgi:hypothetical protein
MGAFTLPLLGGLRGCRCSTWTRSLRGCRRPWSGFLRDWDRSLWSGNYPETTHSVQLSAGGRAVGPLPGQYSPDPAADDAAEDPTDVTRAHVEAFQAWMIETRSASTALNKYKALHQFFKWLMLDEGEIDRSQMERVRQPKMPQKEEQHPRHRRAPGAGVPFTHGCPRPPISRSRPGLTVGVTGVCSRRAVRQQVFRASPKLSTFGVLGGYVAQSGPAATRTCWTARISSSG